MIAVTLQNTGLGDHGKVQPARTHLVGWHRCFRGVCVLNTVHALLCCGGRGAAGETNACEERHCGDYGASHVAGLFCPVGQRLVCGRRVLKGRRSFRFRPIVRN